MVSVIVKCAMFWMFYREKGVIGGIYREIIKRRVIHEAVGDRALGPKNTWSNPVPGRTMDKFVHSTLTSSLKCLNEYWLQNSLRALIAAWPNASQRSRDKSFRLNRSARDGNVIALE